MGEVVRKEVLDALRSAEARGERRMRVIIGLRSAQSLDAVKQALGRMGVKTVARESPTFLAARLTREQIERVSRLEQHVKAIWLNRPVSASQN
jgi:hypothetical protein